LQTGRRRRKTGSRCPTSAGNDFFTIVCSSFDSFHLLFSSDERRASRGEQGGCKYSCRLFFLLLLVSFRFSVSRCFESFEDRQLLIVVPFLHHHHHHRYRQGKAATPSLLPPPTRFLLLLTCYNHSFFRFTQFFKLVCNSYNSALNIFLIFFSILLFLWFAVCIFVCLFEFYFFFLVFSCFCF
jgi:hypothetical protein